MVIAWLTHNVSPSIMKSIMFMNNAADIWSNLEKCFQLTNESRKYKINKDLYELKQQNLSINDYYTAMRSLWEEFDALNTLPTVPSATSQVQNLLDTIASQREEGRLFQFLNGLSDIYNTQRSHFLLASPLPSVEIVSAALQQEESQHDLLQINRLDSDSIAMFSKATISRNDKPIICTVCGGKGHKADKSWHVVGYPKWHSRHGQTPPKLGAHNRVKSSTPRWNYGASFGPSKVAATAQVASDSSAFTLQRLAQLA
ncbi:uncharacterized protein LOC141674919 [Apium graveolens]|uniref:uncharacterized protein LOC141674919 n=1 Tax=Apium graveolens TaxID=4045 RepID=UPI003D78F07D